MCKKAAPYITCGFDPTGGLGSTEVGVAAIGLLFLPAAQLARVACYSDTWFNRPRFIRSPASTSRNGHARFDFLRKSAG
jgi:hypothetical protein